VNYVAVNKPTAPVSRDTFMCSQSAATLKAGGGGTVKWYNAASGGSLVHTGSNYTTPVLNSTTTYYAESTFQDPQQVGGKTDNSDAGGYFSNAFDQHLNFDVYKPVLLVGFTIYAQGDGDRTIEWRNSAGAVLRDTTIYMLDGTQTITLNWK